MHKLNQVFFYLLCVIFYESIVQASSIVLNDKVRNRIVPIEIYKSEQSSTGTKDPLIIINHGYGVSNKDYSYLVKRLTADGYNVVSIQHDLPDDPSLPRTGNLYERRRPLWERGVENILFVIEELKKIEPNLDMRHFTLIGHSNGGDISMLFATQYPHLVSSVISLDSLRMPFPRVSKPRILSLRATDTTADEGVLPTEEEQGALEMKIIKMDSVKHIDMCDQGAEELKKQINKIVSTFLKECR